MSVRSMIVSGAVGASLAYFLDPQQGARRRNTTRDQLVATARRLGGRSEKMARYLGGEAYGLIQETIHLNPPGNPSPDDKTLKDRIESEIFKNTETSRENININVAYGTVELRGELPNQEEIDSLVQRVKSIPNVQEIHNYLHLPGTPAPNKVAAIRAS
jgi:osmotically-inducible protein OsmY